VHDDPKLNRFYPHNVLDDMTRRRRVWAREDEFNFPMAAKRPRDPARRRPGRRRRSRPAAGARLPLGDVGARDGRHDAAEVLQAATIDGAKIIGFDQDLGSIEKGKLADLVVLDRNPLEDIRNTNSVRYVMKNGELYEGDTLDQIWPGAR
jgi:hypothetical protein